MNTYENLVLDKEKLSMITNLIRNRAKDNINTNFDFVDRKGNSLVFLLYGKSGSGKCYIAESICEHINKPLLNINIGTIDLDPSNIINVMGNIFKYATRWNAIILFNNIDIFMENRSSQHLIKNALIGAFIRIFEYYKSKVFLTTAKIREIHPLNINIIVVPHNIFSQWKSYICNYTDMTFYNISKKKDINLLYKLQVEILKNKEIIF